MNREDYEEPCCPLESPNRKERIPLSRALAHYLACVERKEFDLAEQRLLYWLKEAEACGDEEGRLSLLNEKIGLCRTLGRKEEGTEAIREALAMAEKAPPLLQGTTYLNAATGWMNFGQNEKAVYLYEKARKIFETYLPPEDARWGGLYNNYGTALMLMNRWPEAESCFLQALTVMKKQENGEKEIAMTLCNMADGMAREKGMLESEDAVSRYLAEAMRMLDLETVPRDEAYAFACEKCAPAFDYFGYFRYANEIRKRAREIYEGTGNGS